MASTLEVLYIVVSVLNLVVSHFFLRWVPGRPAIYIIGACVTVLLLIQLRIYWLLWRLRGAQPVVPQRPKYYRSSKRKDKAQGQSSAVASTPASSARQRTGNSAVAAAANPSSDTPADGPTATISPFSQVAFRSPRMRAVKSILSLLNIVACSFVFDFAFVPYLFQPAHDLAFMRVGALTPQGAKVLVRDPEASSVQLWTTPLAIKDPVSRDAIMDRILHPAETVSSDTQASEGVPWTYALELNFPANQDFVQVAEFTTLEPSTYYAVKGVRRFANATETEINRVVFRTAPVRLTPAQAASSLTSPGVRFQFGTGSCIKPNFPYVPMSTSRLPGLRRLSRHPIEFMLFLGDFIYADVPYFFGPALEDYRRLYRQVYSDPDALPYLQKIPTIHIYDDHEILNDWDRRDAFPMSNALRAYEEYNGWANPDAPGQGKNAGSLTRRYAAMVNRLYSETVGPLFANSRALIASLWNRLSPNPAEGSDQGAHNNASAEDTSSEAMAAMPSDAPSASSTSLPVNQRRPTYFDFEYGDVAFFVMDARRYRSHIRQPDSANKTMLGAEQKQYLFDWLRAVNHTHAFKFIASSVPLTKNWVWANGQTDTWAGYLTERSEILRVVATVPNVIFLTGDRHEASVTRLGIPETVEHYRSLARRVHQEITDDYLGHDDADESGEDILDQLNEEGGDEADDHDPHSRWAHTNESDGDDTPSSHNNPPGPVAHAVALYDELSIDDRPIDFSTSPVNQFYVPLFDSFNTTTDLDDSIFYRREGNTKFGIFTVDTQSNPDQPTATYQLYTEEGDGQYPIFNFTVYGKKWRKG
ncbi:hypothetical protein H4R33_004115 [Dimargaris cristalligena]|nr:hypothetical protein H4R33_004115 [Dimargaris cristalligena]